jgi:hypothetical protein
MTDKTDRASLRRRRWLILLALVFHLFVIAFMALGNLRHEPDTLVAAIAVVLNGWLFFVARRQRA